MLPHKNLINDMSIIIYMVKHEDYTEIKQIDVYYEVFVCSKVMKCTMNICPVMILFLFYHMHCKIDIFLSF